MDFNQKFNLLMKMVHTTNFEISQELAVDPSLISRWRTGERQVPLSSPYLPKIAQFFAERAKEDFQKIALLELTGRHYEGRDVKTDDMVKYLITWLEGESPIAKEVISRLVNTIGNSDNLQRPMRQIDLPSPPIGTPMFRELFRGRKGLRAATVKLLLEAIKRENSGKKLYLYSDESIDWIFSDPAFAQLWAYLLQLTIKNRVKIEIIHTLQRKSSDLVIAIEKWLPLYLTGAIKSYYYPTKRDDMFNHTAFTLQEVATVTSVSVRGELEENIAYFYSQEARLVQDEVNSFKIQRGLCHPLIRVYTGIEIKNYLDAGTSFFNKSKIQTYSLQGSLLAGMSPALIEKILDRGNISQEEQQRILSNHAERLNSIKENLATQSYKVVTSLPRITDVIRGLVPALIPELLSNHSFFYTPQEFKAHLLELIDTLENNANFRLYIVPQKHIVQGIQLFAIKGQSMVVFKYTAPQFAFISQQNDLIETMATFIENEINKIPKRNRSKAATIARLKNYVNKIDVRLKK